MASFRTKYDAWLILAASTVVPRGPYAVATVWASGSLPLLIEPTQSDAGLRRDGDRLVRAAA